MKKFVALLCMLTCVLSLTACGQEYVPTPVEQEHGTKAMSMSSEFILPYMVSFFDDARMSEYQDNYNVHEVEDIVESDLSYVITMLTQMYGMDWGYTSIDVEGNAILNGMVSYNNTYDSLGDVTLETMGEATYEVSGDEIIVTIPVTGTKKDSAGNLRTAKAEFIFSNDIFLTLKSASLNLNQSTGELMGKAAMDTLMGMGIVFIVLILISLLIWFMGVILSPKKPAAKAEKKEKKQDIKKDAVDNTIAQIIEKEESADDKELVAVIAAAIAAYEGEQSTGGFVVRSIRKRR